MKEWFDNGRLKELLRERRISQAKLARALGINPRVVSRYCNGQRKPGLETLMKMAKYLEVPVAELVPPLRYKEGAEHVR